jgi:hypothetical protein
LKSKLELEVNLNSNAEKNISERSKKLFRKKEKTPRQGEATREAGISFYVKKTKQPHCSYNQVSINELLT